MLMSSLCMTSQPTPERGIEAMVIVTFLLIGVGLVYIGKALGEISDLLYLLTKDDEGGELRLHEEWEKPTPPPKLHTLDEVLKND